MADTERRLLIRQRFEAGGSLRLDTVRGSVQVRGVASAECVVEARYKLPAGIDPAADPTLDRVVGILRDDHGLRIEVLEGQAWPGIAAALGRLVGSSRPSVDFDIQLPRDASLRLSGTNATLRVDGVHGDQEVHTVSGAVTISDAKGAIVVRTVSGDVRLHGGALRLDGSTTSGSVAVETETLELVRLNSVSGDISLGGRLAVGPRHSVESVTGSLQLAPSSGVTVTLRALSGSIRAAIAVRQERRDGIRVAVVGDGAADLQFRTISGDLALLAPRARPDLAATVDVARTNPTLEPIAAPEPGDELSILRALERGDIDVDEAAARLERVAAHG